MRQFASVLLHQPDSILLNVTSQLKNCMPATSHKITLFSVKYRVIICEYGLLMLSQHFWKERWEEFLGEINFLREHNITKWQDIRSKNKISNETDSVFFLRKEVQTLYLAISRILSCRHFQLQFCELFNSMVVLLANLEWF